MDLKLNLPSPITRLTAKLYDQKKLELFIKRDELIHPWIQGNKWRKLKFNIKSFKKSSRTSVVSPGGAFSNHLIALAALCQAEGIKCTGLIRGEEDANNPSIQFMRNSGMALQFVSRSYFRKLHGYTDSEHPDFPGEFFIPEGGTNVLAIEGVGEIIAEVKDQCDDFPKYLITAMGSGGTFAGLLNFLPENCRLIGVSLVGNYSFDQVIQNLLGDEIASRRGQFSIMQNKEFGSFGKAPDFILEYIRTFYEENGIMLDPIYTGKMMWFIDQLIQRDYFKPESRIMVIHTGGLQGWLGFNYRFPGKKGLTYDPKSYFS